MLIFVLRGIGQMESLDKKIYLKKTNPARGDMLL